MKDIDRKILGWICIAPALLIIMLGLFVLIYNIVVGLGIEIVIYGFVIPFIIILLAAKGVDLLSKPNEGDHWRHP